MRISIISLSILGVALVSACSPAAPDNGSSPSKTPSSSDQSNDTSTVDEPAQVGGLQDTNNHPVIEPRTGETIPGLKSNIVKCSQGKSSEYFCQIDQALAKQLNITVTVFELSPKTGIIASYDTNALTATFTRENPKTLVTFDISFVLPISTSTYTQSVNMP
ncbi:MAG: hypothetical protein EOP04_07495 [Proteobacteria bacterium]|nr:MAG: hypothetical protein EOP04_07495 [Pseudomonadota bacterium]